MWYLVSSLHFSISHTYSHSMFPSELPLQRCSLSKAVHHMPNTQMAMYLILTLRFSSGNPTWWVHIAWLGYLSCERPPGLPPGLGPGMSNPGKVHYIFFVPCNWGLWDQSLCDLSLLDLFMNSGHIGELTSWQHCLEVHWSTWNHSPWQGLDPQGGDTLCKCNTLSEVLGLKRSKRQPISI